MKLRGALAGATLVPTSADTPLAQALIRELDAEIVERDPDGPIHGLHPGEHRDPRLCFFVLTVDGEPAGCGAMRQLEPEIAEPKRMFVCRAFRGQGLARVLIRQLEAEAALDRRRIVRELRRAPGATIVSGG